jgi:hypothetical protein
MNYVAAKSVIKTTTELQSGDVIQNGNMFDGFIYYTVLRLETIETKPRSLKLTIQFSHGGSESLSVGKNAHWDVVL